MKKQVFFVIALLSILPTLVYAQVIYPNRGGTGATTTPTTGQVLVGQANGTYAPQATSTLGISGGSGGSGLATTSIDTESELESILTDVTDVFTNNDGALSDDDLSNNTTSDLLEGTNLYYTVARIQSALTSGYNAIFGNSTTTNATTTNLAVTNSFNFLGTVITNVSTWFNGLWDSQFATKTTDNLTEGATNKYNKISTSTTPTNGHIPYWTSNNTLGSIGTGTLTESVSGLQLDNTRGLIGGSAVLSLSSGFTIPTTTDITNWNTAYSWGNHALQGYLSTTSGNWTGTVDGNNFAGGAIGAGDMLYGSGAGTISELGIGASSTLLVSNGSTPFWITGPSICLAITGNAGLCDGDDATGAGGGITSLNALTNSTQTFAVGTSSNIGIGIVSSGSTHTFTPTLASGFSVPSTSDFTNWNTAFGWGDHASVGYLSTTSGDWLGTFDGQEGSYYLSRANHTGTQSSTTITGLGTLAGLSSVDISANTNLTAGDALTLTDDDIDFDGGATPAGELGGTWASPTIDDSLAVTSWNLTTPTLTSFFGTPCTGNQFLQDIGDTGTFTCASASNTAYLATSSPWTAGDLAYVTGQGSVGSVATGTLTETVTGLELSSTRALVGGSAILAITSGYGIPLTASTTEWSNFYSTPSTRITAGTGLSWAGNTLSATGGSASYSTSTADYVIWKVGTVTYGVNGDTGTTIATSTDIGSVMRSILTYATATKGVDGGVIHIKPGQYTSSATTTIYGNGTNYNPVWVIEGAGASTTDIRVTGGSFLNFTNRAEVAVRNMSIDVRGAVNAFSASGITTGVRSVWNSSFENIKIYSGDASHSGYAFHFGNDFRNIYNNIELFGVANGYRTYTQGSAFNNGDSVFNRWFCEINSASNGICFDIDASAGGSVNQSTYIDVNGIADGAGSHTFIKMTGANHNTFIGVNAEQFATTTQLVSGRNNTFEFEYVTPSATGNYFFTGSSAYNNSFGCRYMDNPTGAHILWDDDSNIRGQHNILQGVGNANCVLQGAGTYSVSTTSASIMTNIHDNITGTGLAALLDELKVFGDRIVFDFQTAGTSFMRVVSNVWSLTISNIEVLSLSSTGVKISDDADGAITFTGQSAGNDESLTWNYDDGTANTVGVSSASGVTTVDWGTVGADYDSVSVTLSTILGIIDAGGATSFEIPNGTAPTINATGTIALDTNDNQVVVGTSTTGAVIRLTDRIGGFSISSTTYPYVSGFTTGVAIPFVMERDGYVVTEIHCDIDGGTSIVVNFDNGTGNTSTVTCDTDGASVTGLNSNNVVTAGSVSTSVETGTVTGSPDRLRVSVFGYWVRE